jgi:pilus assembly protein Flp/PilA
MSIVTFLQSWVASLRKDEKGAALVEYGLLVAGIAVASLLIVFTLGDNIAALFTRISDAIGAA